MNTTLPSFCSHTIPSYHHIIITTFQTYFVAVHEYEILQLLLAVNHEQFLEILDPQTLVCLLSRSSYLYPDSVHEFIHEGVVSLMRDILLRCQDLIVAAFHKVLFEGNWDSDVDIGKFRAWNQLNLSVVL